MLRAQGSTEKALFEVLTPGAFAKEPLLPRLPQVQVPTMFLYGVYDWMDYKAAEEARRGMSVPTSLIRVPQAGHQLFLDNPLEFNASFVEGLVSLRQEQQRRAGAQGTQRKAAL